MVVEAIIVLPLTLLRLDNLWPGLVVLTRNLLNLFLLVVLFCLLYSWTSTGSTRCALLERVTRACRWSTCVTRCPPWRVNASRWWLYRLWCYISCCTRWLSFSFLFFEKSLCLSFVFNISLNAHFHIRYINSIPSFHIHFKIHFPFQFLCSLIIFMDPESGTPTWDSQPVGTFLIFFLF